jgi:hypothetical protein
MLNWGEIAMLNDSLKEDLRRIERAQLRIDAHGIAPRTLTVSRPRLNRVSPKALIRRWRSPLKTQLGTGR